MKRTRQRRLLIALLVIIVGVFGIVAWLVRPERPKDVTLRLKFVTNEVVEGKSQPLFRIVGADKYEVFVRGYTYVQANEPPLATNAIQFAFHNPPPTSRQIHADDLDITNQCWQMQADVWVLVPDDKFTKISDVIKDIWRLRKRNKASIFAIWKWLWSYPHNHVISEQVITSDVITNPPPH